MAPHEGLFTNVQEFAKEEEGDMDLSKFRYFCPKVFRVVVVVVFLIP